MTSLFIWHLEPHACLLGIHPIMKSYLYDITATVNFRFQYTTYVKKKKLLSSFYLNGYTLGFTLQISSSQLLMGADPEYLFHFVEVVIKSSLVCHLCTKISFGSMMILEPIFTALGFDVKRHKSSMLHKYQKWLVVYVIKSWAKCGLIAIFLNTQ